MSPDPDTILQALDGLLLPLDVLLHESKGLDHVAPEDLDVEALGDGLVREGDTAVDTPNRLPEVDHHGEDGLQPDAVLGGLVERPDEVGSAEAVLASIDGW